VSNRMDDGAEFRDEWIDREQELFFPMVANGANLLHLWLAPWELNLVHRRKAEMWPVTDESGREIDGRFPGGSIVLVGHEPDLGELLSFWLTGSIEGFATHFRKGAVACVSGAQLPPQRRAVLEWLLTADQLGGLDAG